MLKLIAMGKPHELHPFIFDLTSQPQYRVRLESMSPVGCPGQESQETSVQMSVSFTPTSQTPVQVILHTRNNQEIKIHFTDGFAVKLSDTVTYIGGKAADVFG